MCRHEILPGIHHDEGSLQKSRGDIACGRCATLACLKPDVLNSTLRRCVQWPRPTDRHLLACTRTHIHSQMWTQYADQLISSEAGLRRAEREILISVKTVFKQARMGEA